MSLTDLPSQALAKKVRRKYPQFVATYEKWEAETVRDSNIRGEVGKYLLPDGESSMHVPISGAMSQAAAIPKCEDGSNVCPPHAKSNLYGCLVFLGEGVQSGVTDFRPMRQTANYLARLVDKAVCGSESNQRIVAGKLCFHSERPFTIVELLIKKDNDNKPESEANNSANKDNSTLSCWPLCACYASSIHSGKSSNVSMNATNLDSKTEATSKVPDSVSRNCEWVTSVPNTATPKDDDFFAVRLLLADDGQQQMVESLLLPHPQRLPLADIVALIANCDGVPVVPVELASDAADSSRSGDILKPIPIREVPGLFAVPNFISAEEEQLILKQLEAYDHPAGPPSSSGHATDKTISSDSNNTTTPWEQLARRDVLHFSRRFFYDTMTVGKVGEQVSGPNPPFYEALIDRLCTGIIASSLSEEVTTRKRQREGVVEEEEGSYIKGEIASSCLHTHPHPNPEWPVPLDHRCDQLTVNRYRYDQSAKHSSGIAQHVDVHSPFGDIVFSISLASHTLLEYERPRLDNKEIITKRVPIFAAPRSLIIMTGESRFLWTHAIQHKYADVISEDRPALVRKTRVSLTLRKARDKPAVEHNLSNCPYPIMCDSKV